ncbi:hypothetical protein CAEBREN_00384 [Caenorhabditis brenneri]|uniref:Uncharacterized protein n=1 Tax=Caenorhabditis brenneri TaxID=135651 RepID=G0PAU9_CAEBE|nr:hypothetical protein CAEBREN_00384 [Caenorhabditis brenneri]
MAEIWIRRLEFNLGTRASREYVFSPQFIQLEHTPLNTDVALSLNVVDFMSRRMNKNGRSRYSMDYVGKRCSKEEYGQKMEESGIKAEGMIHKGRNQVGVILSDEAGNEIQPNDVSGVPLVNAYFSLICAITKALGRRNLVVDSIYSMYGNDAREMMSRVDELCKLQNLQIIATSEPTNLYHREIRVIQI